MDFLSGMKSNGCETRRCDSDDGGSKSSYSHLRPIGDARNSLIVGDEVNIAVAMVVQ